MRNEAQQETDRLLKERERLLIQIKEIKQKLEQIDKEMFKYQCLVTRKWKVKYEK